jgi:hypothetical protein
MQATQTIAVPSVPLQFPQQPQPHKLPQQISQIELRLLLSLQGRLAQLESEIDKAEEDLKARLQAGASVEPGDHFAELKTNSRRNVSWKDVAKRLAIRLKLDGERYCERVIAATRPTKTVSLEVQ